MTAQDQQSRAEFEEHHAARFTQPLTRWVDTYANAHVRCRWEGWQAARALPAGVTPAAGQSRFVGEVEWRVCTVEHVRMVLASPQDWEGYEVRYLYAAARVQAVLDAGNPGNKLPPGWQAVPVEPTPEMAAAYDSACFSDYWREEGYAALLAAAPRPPAAPDAGIPASTAAAQELVSFMDRAVLRMPYNMAMSSELARAQFYQRVQGVLDRIGVAAPWTPAAQEGA